MQKVYFLTVKWINGEAYENYFYSLKFAFLAAGMLRGNPVVKYMTLKTGWRDSEEWVKEIARAGLT